jgi:hypothetical protein
LEVIVVGSAIGFAIEGFGPAARIDAAHFVAIFVEEEFQARMIWSEGKSLPLDSPRSGSPIEQLIPRPWHPTQTIENCAFLDRLHRDRLTNRPGRTAMRRPQAQ